MSASSCHTSEIRFPYQSVQFFSMLVNLHYSNSKEKKESQGENVSYFFHILEFKNAEY